MPICTALAICALALSSQRGIGLDDVARSAIEAGHASVAAMSPPLVAAHRGGFFHNQGGLTRIKQTIAAGHADVIEIDLQATSDGKVFVYHDPLLQSHTDCTGAIGDLTYAQVASCRLKDSGEPVPLFSDVIQAAGDHAILDAEFKTEATIAPGIDMARQWNAIDRIYFQLGGDRKRYQTVRALSMDSTLQFKALSDEDLDWALSLDDPQLRIIEMDRNFISKDRIKAAHDHAKLVSFDTWRRQYTEERFAASCRWAYTSGVDIAVTNNPDSCARQRHSKPYSAPHRWIYAAIGRPHVRQFARDISSMGQSAFQSAGNFVADTKEWIGMENHR
ncbi:glycerophosphodiester phosphodiesterase family protein [Thermomonas sp.]|uniref:glycerophosphodiester phosphodiesterase n=1 Tax=Thermomonas sp. TaxID=1971895 RepID=UPI002488302E|nr:glycerophosphodiester phosphodiesterase family protein [Thermomonas sp.]MDI1251841.1 glycerophosphodiester phosphodiesterase family protein [Thermomonas sp.]